ncbi:MAG TPA: Crp/Fnr family transcriptional regulator [Gammaproteobacteria bacterium]|jgi:CRP-like cAMP-binding protein
MNPKHNRILAALPEADYERLYRSLQQVSLTQGESLHRLDEQVEYVYFPLDCLVAVVYITPNTTAAEIAVTGREGMIGLEMLLDDVAMPRWAVPQISGQAMRISAALLKEEYSRSPAMRQLFTRFMQALITQMMQLAVCSRHHDVGQQLPRLLLSCLDRMPGDTIEMSHEALAGALGIAPEDITRVALDLWSAGVIEQGAGRIKVLDRTALEARACECYATVCRQYDGLLPGWSNQGRSIRANAKSPDEAPAGCDIPERMGAALEFMGYE